ncbi:unnamed protein product, partial [Iphiclides podalirius]
MSKANIISDVIIQLPAKLNVECAPNRLDSKAVTLMELGESNTGSWKCSSMGVDTPTVTTDTVHEFVPEYPTGPKDIRDMDLEKDDYLDDIIQQGDDLTSENETEEQSGTKTQSDYDTKLNVQYYANEAENIEKAVKES